MGERVRSGFYDADPGVGAGSPYLVNIETPHWLTDRQMWDLIDQVARGACAHFAPKTAPRMITAFYYVLDRAPEDRVSKTLSWLSDWRGGGRS